MQTEGYGFIGIEEYKRRLLQDLRDKKLIYDKQTDAVELNVCVYL